jgi:dipeptidyl aminopeptidase/acylaminoacyl peptidase
VAVQLCCCAAICYAQVQKRPFTVADSIELTTIVDPDNGDEPTRPVTGAPGKRSPDGRFYAVIVMKGDVIHNTIDYRLLIYETKNLQQRPAEVLRMTSTSSRAGISRIRWLSDSRRIAFLGERAQQTTQLYVVDTLTRRLRQLTNEPNLIVDYDLTQDGASWIYLVKSPARPVPHELNERGYAITITDLSLAMHSMLTSPLSSARDLYLGRQAWGQRARRIQSEQEIWFAAIAPNGRNVIESLPVANVPAEWEQYQSPGFQRILAMSRRGPDHPNYVHQLFLLDLQSAVTRPLLDAPGGWFRQRLVWTSNGKEVVVFASLLPPRLAAQHSWSGGHVVAVDLQSRDVRLLQASEVEEITPIVLDNPEIRIREGLNEAPQLESVDSQSKVAHIFTDFNPQLRQLNLAEEKIVQWQGKDGSEWNGGLYYPPEYHAGKRYPLVIQTHGFDDKRFEVSGSYPTAMAAQALANKGMLVLQVDGPRRGANAGANEAGTFVNGVEGAIDYLFEAGLVDRERVGLIGFSRTGWHVEYFLTHSKYRIAAATAADNIDQSYVQYLSNSSAGAAETEEFYGGNFWNHRERWLSEAPGFNLDKIRTPLRLEIESDSVYFQLSQWEMFVGLRKLKKPVDLIYLPGAPHLLVRPWHRLTSQGGNVDWFCFWLKSEEDPDPIKRSQYERWRRLRALAEIRRD